MAVFNLLALLFVHLSFFLTSGLEHAHRGLLRKKSTADPTSFVKAIEFKHQLRVCNAYAYAGAVDVYRAESERLTVDGPMPYKACRDFKAELKSGDKLEFRLGDTSAGTFSVSDLPNNDAVLLLVIHRHDTVSTAVAFESHVFAALDNAQVAIIDTYKGKRRSTATIMHKASEADTKLAAVGEDLRYDSVVAINPGDYEVSLKTETGHEDAKAKLAAVRHGSYVVIRMGVEAREGASYPQELVVYPGGDTIASLGGAVGGRGHATASLLALLVSSIAILLF